VTLERTQAGVAAPPAGSREEAALSLCGIRKRWDERDVLAGVDLAVPPASLVWLGGRNGAGKTTLLRIAGGLIMPDEGHVRLRGLDPERDRRAYQRRLGYLSAGNGGLYARLSVADNLELFASLALIPARERDAAVTRAIERFDLGELAGSRTDRLSTGQRQRVRLASAFIHDPDVVLLDEPHTSLDEEGLDVLRAALTDLVDRSGAAVWCAPSPEHTGLPHDRGYVIDDGRAVPA
jgi:ABC-2 type transport system ATP-binding protein